MDQPAPSPTAPTANVPVAASSTVRTWCVLAHASALAGFFVPWAGHVVGPLVVWLAKRDESPEIDAHAREALNFQISMLIWNAISWVLVFVVIGIFGLILLHILNVILVVVATIQAADGKLYRYPLALQIIR